MVSSPPQLLFDMSSMGSAEPQTLTPQQNVATWEAGLNPIHAIHHQAGNFLVRIDDARADVSCYGVALHYRANAGGRNSRTFVGSYDFRLRNQAGRWRIASFKFNLKYSDGNANLEACCKSRQARSDRDPGLAYTGYGTQWNKAIRRRRTCPASLLPGTTTVRSACA